MTPAEIARFIACIDLTRLQEHDTGENIAALCAQAVTPLGPVASVCVYPDFVATAWSALIATPVKVAAVANFPHGRSDIVTVTQEIQRSILDGAAEIDVVIPYHYYPRGERAAVRDFIAHCKYVCGENVLLKTILETGCLSPEHIQQASEDAIAASADFLKTSTGKVPVGATPEAATILLRTIAHSAKPVGFKASGGIRTLVQAQQYAGLVSDILGDTALTPQRFRLGASVLLDNLLAGTKQRAINLAG